ncbi:MAG: response regulator [Desulfobacteraceae bacterium]|nr:response regulator [Desulfobacteraceae bacterium]
MRVNIKLKIWLPAFILFMAGMSTLSAFVYINSKDALIAASEDQMVLIADMTRKNMDLWIEEIRMALDSWKDQEILRTATREGFLGNAARRSVNQELGKYKTKYPYYEHISLSSVTGEIIASSDTGAIGQASISKHLFFKHSMDGRIHQSPVMQSPVSGRPVFTIAGPVFRESNIVGVLFAGVDIADFRQRFIDPIKVGVTGYAFIVGKEGRVFVHPDPSAILELDLTDYDFGRRMLIEGNGSLKAKWREMESLVVYRTSDVTGWTIGVNAPIDNLFEPVYRIGRLNIALCIIIITLTGLVLYAVAKFGIIGTIDGLVRAREAAESTTRAKNNFMAAISHEIRTPMNAIIGMTDIVLESELTIRQRENLRIVRKSADHLLNLINNILDFSKIEAKKLRLTESHFDLPSILRETRAVLSYKAEKKGLSINCKVHPNTPRFVRGDPHRLRQIIFNLINNAVKFTDTGHVSVHAKPAPSIRESSEGGPDSSASVTVQFMVEDTGEGIPQDKRDTIFESFTQLDGGYSRRHGGTGLGLSISKELAELMGGRIWCDSRVGAGSRFTFEIPFRTSTCEQVKAQEQNDETTHTTKVTGTPTKLLNILLADDFEINQQLFVPLLENIGHRVQVVSNGEEAISAIEKDQFDLILMDIQMPVMDGVEATRRIRSHENPAISILPIIAITAHAVTGDREKFLHAGVDDYITKPIDSKILFNTIDQISTKCSWNHRESGTVSAPPTVDLDRALEMMDNNTDILMTACRTILEKLPDQMTILREAVVMGDAGNIKRLAHSVKTTAGSVGADATAEISYSMERLAGKDNITEAANLLPELENHIHHMLAALRTAIASRSSSINPSRINIPPGYSR